MNPDSLKSTETSAPAMPWYANLVADLGALVGDKNFGLRLSFLALLTAGGCAGGAITQPPEGPQSINPRELQMLLMQNGLSTGIQADGSKINDIKMVASGSLMDILGKEDELRKQGKTVKRLRFGGGFVLVVVEQDNPQKKGRLKISYAPVKIKHVQQGTNTTEYGYEVPPPPRYKDDFGVLLPPGWTPAPGPEDRDTDSIDTEISTSLLRELLKENQEYFYNIYLDAKAKNPSLKGKILVHFVTDDDGSIWMVHFPKEANGQQKTLTDTVMEDAIAKRVKQWKMPLMGTADDAMFTLEFH